MKKKQEEKRKWKDDWKWYLRKISVLRILKLTSNMNWYDAEENIFIFDIYKMQEHNRIENRCDWSKREKRNENELV